MKKIICVLICALMAVPLISCGRIQGAQKYSQTAFDLFDTVVTVTAYDESQAAFDGHFNEFTALLEEYDKAYDIYNSYDGLNNLKTVNDNAGIAPVEVDGKILDLLNEGKAVYEQSGGRVNICLGAVLSIWHNYREADANAVPSVQELENAAQHTAIGLLELTDTTAYIKDSEASLDVGAIAKGYAAEQACKYAKENLWSSAVISVGGNVIAYGAGNGEGWNIAIENPKENAGDYLHTLGLTEKAVVTSADTQRYYYVDGKKYCHIINPETLFPSEYMHSVTVIADSSAEADALTTMLFNMSIDDGSEYVEGLDGVEAVFVDLDYNEVFTSGFEAYIKR